jgi:4-amino-4-deoxy-L-arabinose transferase-like glycosyltransferase
MISNKRYWFLMFLILCVYLSGIDVTLFENDSAQFAVMAMRMVQENDFLNLFKGSEEYLDKPHMHYWLAAMSFKVFGIHDWAYRIPAILATLLGGYSCFGLGRLLYDSDTGKLAALIFLTAQTIVLSVIDVRTDAVLTGFTILAIWQLAAYIQKNSLPNLLMGAFVAGMAFSTKGQIALVVIGFPILCHLVYTKKWKFLFHWKTLLALMVFAITIAPMLYAYYHQFDLHPEKIIRGRDGRSGIFFIFWEQSFERMSGTGMGKNSSAYFFFFHTFLWIFLPWTIVGILAVSNRFKSFFKSKFKNGSDRELLTLGGIVLIFITISFAQFKLPHYLNITIPLFAILTAAYLQNLYQNKQAKTIKTILGIQYFIVAVMFIACLFICYYVFKFESYEKSVFLGLVFVLVVYYCMKKEAYYPRIITISVIGSLMLNGVMNTHFYPSLLTYQSGSTMAEVVAENKISTDNIYKISEQHTWALDFYNKEPVKLISIEALKDKSDFWVYAYDTQLRQLQQLGFDWDRQFTAKQFRITRLQAKFLDPSSRKKVLRKRHLVHIY